MDVSDLADDHLDREIMFAKGMVHDVMTAEWLLHLYKEKDRRKPPVILQSNLDGDTWLKD